MKPLTVVSSFFVAAWALNAQAYAARSDFGARLEPQAGLMHGGARTRPRSQPTGASCRRGASLLCTLYSIGLRDLQPNWADAHAAYPGVFLIPAIGFGLPVNPLVNGSSTQSGALPTAPVCQVGGSPASPIASLISPGLYQVNLTLPAGAQSGDDPISYTCNGANTPAGDFINVQK